MQESKLSRWPLKPVIGAVIKDKDLHRCAYRAKIRKVKDGDFKQRLTKQEICRPAMDDYVESNLEVSDFRGDVSVS